MLHFTMDGEVRKLRKQLDTNAAALPPMPENIDEQIDVPVPRDTTGAACCPHCSVQLAEVEKHDRIVQDIIPAKVIARCNRTISGCCPGCRKRVESRAPVGMRKITGGKPGTNHPWKKDGVGRAAQRGRCGDPAPIGVLMSG